MLALGGVMADLEHLPGQEPHYFNLTSVLPHNEAPEHTQAALSQRPARIKAILEQLDLKLYSSPRQPGAAPTCKRNSIYSARVDAQQRHSKPDWRDLLCSLLFSFSHYT